MGSTVSNLKFTIHASGLPCNISLTNENENNIETKNKMFTNNRNFHHINLMHKQNILNNTGIVVI